MERQFKPRRDLRGCMEVNGLHQLHQRLHVTFIVEFLKEVLALRLALLVDVFEVALLQEAGIAQHDVTELAGLGAGEHASAEPGPHELRQVAGMVDMGVGEDHVVDRLGIDRKVAVLFERLLAVPLIETAVQKNPLAAGFDEMHGASRGAGRTEKCDFHPLLSQ